MTRGTLCNNEKARSLNVLSGDLSVLVLRQLLIEISDSGGWGPVDGGLLKVVHGTLCFLVGGR